MQSTNKRMARVTLGEKIYVGGDMYEVVTDPVKDPVGDVVLWLARSQTHSPSITMHVDPMLIMEVFQPQM